MASLGVGVRGCVNVFFLAAIHRWAGSRHLHEERHFDLTLRQRGRVPRDGPLCMDSILLVDKKQWGEVNETSPTCSQILFFSVTEREFIG